MILLIFENVDIFQCMIKKEVFENSIGHFISTLVTKKTHSILQLINTACIFHGVTRQRIQYVQNVFTPYVVQTHIHPIQIHTTSYIHTYIHTIHRTFQIFKYVNCKVLVYILIHNIIVFSCKSYIFIFQN